MAGWQEDSRGLEWRSASRAVRCIFHVPAKIYTYRREQRASWPLLPSTPHTLALGSRRLPRTRTRHPDVSRLSRSFPPQPPLPPSPLPPRARITPDSQPPTYRSSLKVPGDTERVFKRCNFLSPPSLALPRCEASLSFSFPRRASRYTRFFRDASSSSSSSVLNCFWTVRGSVRDFVPILIPRRNLLSPITFRARGLARIARTGGPITDAGDAAEWNRDRGR